MNKVHLVTLSRLQRANYKVCRELQAHGYWDEKLAAVQVRLGVIGSPYGWQDYGGSGDIVIPAVSFSKIGDLFKRRYTSLVDVLRHEYGHAVADTHRRLMHRRSLGFEKAFWAPHSDETIVQYDPEIHVSEYAATNAAEDFSETFMRYLKHNGRLPTRFNTRFIRAKWRFIRRLGKEIGKRR